jgi:hypothetical protein
MNMESQDDLDLQQIMITSLVWLVITLTYTVAALCRGVAYLAGITSGPLVTFANVARAQVYPPMIFAGAATAVSVIWTVPAFSMVSSGSYKPNTCYQ